MPEASLYEQVLRSMAGRATPPLKAPRPSAAVVPWRQGPGGGELEVFWVQRSPALAFMGGWHAFPGGGISRDDAAVRVAGAARGLAADNDAPGLVAGALRELAEEVGLHPRADELVYAGRWLTPPFGPLRFDNRFFLLEWPAERATQPLVDPGELIDGEWVAPSAALERWRRGDAMAAPPVLHFLQVLTEDGPERGLARLLDPSETMLGELRRIEFRPGTLAFPLASLTLPPATTTNAFLLGFGDAVLVDPGAADPAETARLVTALAAARERLGRRVVAIWLTHHHPDHIAGVQALRCALDVPVLAHPRSAARLLTAGVSLDGVLEDGHVVELAGEPPMRVRILHTPGHARGHLCFLDEERGTLIAGDLLSGLGTVVIDPPEGNMDEYIASLERMHTLAPRTLLPAHGAAIHDARAKLGEAIAHRLAREHKVLTAWRAGERDAETMIDAVYDDTPGAARPLAVRQIRAHLERLQRQGQLGSGG